MRRFLLFRHTIYLSNTETSSAWVAMAMRIPGMKCMMLFTVTCVSRKKDEKPVMNAQICPRVTPLT